MPVTMTMTIAIPIKVTVTMIMIIATKVTISIMFYYTDAFANLTSDIVTYIDHVLDIANQGYINSGLPITVMCFTIPEL